MNPNEPRKRLEIVLLATGAFAVPSMIKLCESGEFHIVCLITNPIRRDRAGREIETPAKKFAKQFGIPISDKEDVHSLEFSEFLYLVRPDLLFVCDFGQILSKRVLEGSLLGGLNLHGSLLPKLRGAAPVNRAILEGEKTTGISIIHMTPQIDAGPVIAQSPPITIGLRETAPELEHRLAELGAELVLDTVQKMARGETIRIIEQLHREASKAPRLKKEEGNIDWTRSAIDIFNHTRGMTPWPKSYTTWKRSDGSELRLILGSVTPLDNSLHKILPGESNNESDLQSESAESKKPQISDAKFENLAKFKERKSPVAETKKTKIPTHPHQHGVILKASDGELLIGTGGGVIRVEAIQPAGKTMISAANFLLGYPIEVGDRLVVSDK